MESGMGLEAGPEAWQARVARKQSSWWLFSARNVAHATRNGNFASTTGPRLWPLGWNGLGTAKAPVSVSSGR